MEGTTPTGQDSGLVQPSFKKRGVRCLTIRNRSIRNLKETSTESWQAADPAARVSHILRLLAEHPRGLLILPTLEGRRATLDGIDLSREQLLNDTRVPKTSLWWNAERQALGLRRADLRGASLRAARLVGAFLEEADLAGADLAGADMHGVDLSGANLTGTLLEGCDLRKGVLRFVRGERSVMEFAKLQDADLWVAQLRRRTLVTPTCAEPSSRRLTLKAPTWRESIFAAPFLNAPI